VLKNKNTWAKFEKEITLEEGTAKVMNEKFTAEVMPDAEVMPEKVPAVAAETSDKTYYPAKKKTDHHAANVAGNAAEPASDKGKKTPKKCHRKSHY
jgi:hypothetical protein